MDMNAVNALSYEDFLEIFGNVIEKCPMIPAAIWIHRPFTGLADIEAHISDFIDSLPESGTVVDRVRKTFHLRESRKTMQEVENLQRKYSSVKGYFYY